jgi:hypothetical protein
VRQKWETKWAMFLQRIQLRQSQTDKAYNRMPRVHNSPPSFWLEKTVVAVLNNPWFLVGDDAAYCGSAYKQNNIFVSSTGVIGIYGCTTAEYHRSMRPEPNDLGTSVLGQVGQ